MNTYNGRYYAKAAISVCQKRNEIFIKVVANEQVHSKIIISNFLPLVCPSVFKHSLISQIKIGIVRRY